MEKVDPPEIPPFCNFSVKKWRRERVKLLNDTDDTNVKDTLLAGLAVLAAAIHRISKFRQSHYDEFSDISYESLKDKDPSVKPFYGDDYIQDIQSCTKSGKVTETAFSLSTKV